MRLLAISLLAATLVGCEPPKTKVVYAICKIKVLSGEKEVESHEGYAVWENWNGSVSFLTWPERKWKTIKGDYRVDYNVKVEEK